MATPQGHCCLSLATFLIDCISTFVGLIDCKEIPCPLADSIHYNYSNNYSLTLLYIDNNTKILGHVFLPAQNMIHSQTNLAISLRETSPLLFDGVANGA